ncbi:MAG: DEAD/DEAH box helicase family protein [Natrialbaceae archaeon]|nr:DEAD/DEAH box helicase family protein [Natrialbaceae archaeon]
MEIIQRFIHLEEEEVKQNGVTVDTKETLIFPRYHQLDCVRKLVRASRDEGPGHNYLIQHSTGSGKSKSIAWLVHRLISLHDAEDDLVFDSVVVVTDRTVLDEQLQDTIYELDQRAGVVHGIEGDGTSKSDELADALEKNKPIIITTLQTFPHVIEHIASLPDRDYAVVVDEAHSSQTGEMSTEMKGILAGLDIDDVDDIQEAIADESQSPRQAGKHQLLRVHGDAEGQDPRSLRTGTRGGRRSGRLPPLLDAPGDRGRVHPRRPRELHDLQDLLQHREGDRGGPAGPEEAGGVGHHTLPHAASAQRLPEGRDHRRALPKQHETRDRRQRRRR